MTFRLMLPEPPLPDQDTPCAEPKVVTTSPRLVLELYFWEGVALRGSRQIRITLPAWLPEKGTDEARLGEKAGCLVELINMEGLEYSDPSFRNLGN